MEKNIDLKRCNHSHQNSKSYKWTQL